MDWLAILALAIWVLVERQRTTKLERELADLRLQRSPPIAPPAAQPIPTAPWPAAAPVAPAPAMSTPRQVAEATAAEAIRETPRLAITPLAAATPPPASTFTPTARPPPQPSEPPRPSPISRSALEKWVAERGLAWIGGSALVIGGAFLVGYAAQLGFFTPLMRIIAAAVLGAAMIGAGEAIRRGRLAGFGRNQLVAAVTSGGGAAVLYATTWAAWRLYGFIPGSVCGALLAAIALGLLALAFVHGEALAVLALAGAFAAPLLTGGDFWTLEALSLYLGILVAAGAAIGWLRRWSVALWTNLAGAAAWSLLAAVQQDALKCLLLGLEPLAAIAVLAYALPRPQQRALGPGVAVAASFAAILALGVANQGGQPLLVGVLAGLALPFLTAALQRKRQVPAWSLAAPGVAFTLAAAMARSLGYDSPTLTGLWCLQVLALDVAALWAAWRDERRAMSGAGALSSLALALIAGAGIGVGPLAALAPAVAGLALALGAVRLATDRTRPVEQRALEIWGGGAAAALLAVVALGLSWRWAAFGFAAATLGLALVARRLQWRGIAIAAAVGAGLGLAALLNPPLLVQALKGGVDAGFLLACGLVVAAASFVAARIVRHDRGAAEALRTLSPLAALVGAFVFLRWLAGGPGGLPLDGLTESSIRTFLIADAGLASLVRIGAETSAFARWRGHALMLAAAAHGLFFQGLLYNPRLGLMGDVAGGVPLLNTLALAYLVPAILFAVAAARIYRRERPMARVYAVIALLTAVTWAFLEIRRLLHGPHLAGDLATIGAGEAVADSLVLFALAVIGGRLRPRGEAPAHPWRGDVGVILVLLRGLAVGFGVLVVGLWSNPCWGVAAQPLGSWPALAAVLAGIGLMTPLAARLALDARAEGRPREADVHVAASMLFGVMLASLVVRAVFHGTDLTLGGPTSQLETWSYSAVWAAVGLGFIGVSRAGGRLFLRAGLALLLVTTAKVFIFDTASLSGVVRAGSFLALGVLLLLGALTARRIAEAGRKADAG